MEHLQNQYRNARVDFKTPTIPVAHPEYGNHLGGKQDTSLDGISITVVCLGNSDQTDSRYLANLAFERERFGRKTTRL